MSLPDPARAAIAVSFVLGTRGRTTQVVAALKAWTGVQSQAA